MTTAIIAKDYDDARQAAAEFGVGNDWVYPHDIKLVQGRTFNRLVFVSGYTEGAITAEIAAMIYTQTTDTAPVIHHELGQDDFDAILAPFLDPDSIEIVDDYTPRHATRRPVLAGMFLSALIGAGIALAGLMSAVFLGWLPWG